MINILTKQINESLNNNCYMAALITAIILPDICGKAKYPDLKNKERYVNWYDEYIGNYEINPVQSIDMPYLSGELVWKLRCSLLHEGNPNVNRNDTGIDYFELLWQGNQRCAHIMDHAMVQKKEDGSIVKKAYLVNIARICTILCSAAKDYYTKNKNIFEFFNYNISNVDNITKNYSKLR